LEAFRRWCQFVDVCQEASEQRECLVPKIAGLPLPLEMPDVVDELAEMYAALSGTVPCLDSNM